jgi:hypothetical protein
MAVPLVPIATVALRYGTVALATYAVARTIERGRRDQRAEDALDDLQDGVTLRRDPEQMNATARMRRVIRLGRSGVGVEIDATALTRIRFKKV